MYLCVQVFACCVCVYACVCMCVCVCARVYTWATLRNRLSAPQQRSCESRLMSTVTAPNSSRNVSMLHLHVRAWFVFAYTYNDDCSHNQSQRNNTLIALETPTEFHMVSGVFCVRTTPEAEHGDWLIDESIDLVEKSALENRADFSTRSILSSLSSIKDISFIRSTFRVSFHGFMQKRRRKCSIPPKLCIANSFNNEEKLDRRLVRVGTGSCLSVDRLSLLRKYLKRDPKIIRSRQHKLVWVFLELICNSKLQFASLSLLWVPNELLVWLGTRNPVPWSLR